MCPRDPYGTGEFSWSRAPVLTALISFLIIAAVVYFLVVVPYNRLQERRARGQEQAPTPPPEDIALLTEIRDLLADGHRPASGTGTSPTF